MEAIHFRFGKSLDLIFERHSSKPMFPKLYIFPISHFSEKARWGLELARQDYELCLLNPSEYIDTIKSIVPESSLPVLAFESKAIQGSSLILDSYELAAFGRIMSVDERILSEEIDLKFGKSLQTILYSYLLEKPDLIAKLFSTTPLPKEKIAESPKDFPLLALGLRRKYRINQKNVESAKLLFVELAQKLKTVYQAKTFYDGQAFGRIDLSFASLISPLFKIEDHPAYDWFSSIEFPVEFQEWVSSLELDILRERVLYFYKNFRKTN